jgi:hypothetical protein
MAARETTEKLVDVNQKLKQKCDDVVEVVASLRGKRGSAGQTIDDVTFLRSLLFSERTFATMHQ